MKFILQTVLVFLTFQGYSQQIKGIVSDIFGTPLIGATVQWKDTSLGTITDSLGQFELKKVESTSILAFSYVGYKSDTLDVKNFEQIKMQLIWSENIEEVVIQDRKSGTILSNLSPIKTEQITQTELSKAACCDLAGCFETQASVQVQTTNIITNAKELRISGLSGVYNQVLIDGLPLIQGLTYTYGISSIPGTMVDNIYIAKGANSVLQGYESISGQINVETKDPRQTEQLYLNAYVNNFGESHLNGNIALKSNKWNSLTSIHTIMPARKVDRDKDGFLDLPQIRRYRIANKTTYGDSQQIGWHSTFGVRYLSENRTGGQMEFDANNDLGSTEIYGQHVNINQPELWTKTGYRLSTDQNILFLGSTFYQDQKSYFGTTSYDAQQYNVYANLQYEKYYSDNTLKTGVSYRRLRLNENIQFTNNDLQRTFAGSYKNTEDILGIFAENTLSFLNKKLTWIAGIRADHHNAFGFQFTPRSLIKYDINPNTVVRANVGTGWRTVNLFSENINLLISSRDVIFLEDLEPEKALNTGVNLTHKYDRGRYSGYISIDYYHNRFQNQIFPDYDTDPTKAIIANFKGISISNTFQVESNVQFLKEFECKVAYTYLDVYRMSQEVKQTLPFNPKHKIVGSFSYRPISNKYYLDLNMHYYGKQKLPNTSSNPEPFRRPDFSDHFTTLNLQFTYLFQPFEIYVGCENIFDYRQLRPIISWQNPFSPYFDTSSVWGPTRGRELYIGARYKLNSL